MSALEPVSVGLTASSSHGRAVAAKVAAGTPGHDRLDGDAGADTLSGLGGNDTLIGNEGADQLLGGDGADQLNGGAGNDVLQGGNGRDFYVFRKGYGQDRIDNRDDDAVGVNADKVLLGAGITPKGLGVARDGDDLVLQLKGTSDQLTLSGYFLDDARSRAVVETIEFTDGTVWNVAKVKAKVLAGSADGDHLDGFGGADKLSGLGGQDELHGRDGNDKLKGGGGNDVLWGDAGNDTLDGGTGDDVLRGGDGRDVYVFRKGYGDDRIENQDSDALGVNADKVLLGPGIAPKGVSLVRDGDDLVLRLKASGDQLTISGYFHDDATSGAVVETIQFSDSGTVWDVDTVKAKVLTGTAANDHVVGYAGADALSGLSGDDTLQGRDGDDTLDGGAGHDLLVGGNGSDTYVFGLSSGIDRIENWDEDAPGVNADKVLLDDDIAPQDVSLDRSGDDLVLSLTGTFDQLTIAGYFRAEGPERGAVESIEFADGTVWDVAMVTAKVGVIGGSEDDNFIQGSSDADELHGLGGNDVIVGLDGDDTLHGDDGQDQLVGGAGADQLHGGAGDDGLEGEWGDDTLDGGAGDDVLAGGWGSDVYVFGPGYGHDRIDNWDDDAPGTQPDKVLMAEGIAAGDVSVARDGDDLVLSLTGTDDRLTLSGYFYAGDDAAPPVETIEFADGTVWDVAAVRAQVTFTEGDDYIQGSDAPDELHGLGGNDQVFGLDGDDTLHGDDGQDQLDGGAGADLLLGGAGDDGLAGQWGDDTLDGGTGDDVLAGGWGSDTYVFGLGYGHDRIDNWDDDAPGTQPDKVLMAEGIAAGDVSVARDGDDLVLSLTGTDDQLTLSGYFYAGDDAAIPVETIEFADGTVWDVGTIKALLNPSGPTEDSDYIQGSDGPDELSGLGGDDQVFGLDGDDTLYGNDGQDQLSGGAGSDQLHGGAGDDWVEGLWGDDTLDGGEGSDVLSGGWGSDTYVFGPGYGQDRIDNWDDDAAGTQPDRVLLAEGVTADDVSVVRYGDDLVLGLAGTDDRLTISNYFYADGQDAPAVQTIEFADGTVWDVAAVLARAVVPTEADDQIRGYAGADELSGLGGDDLLLGMDGDDTLHGNDGQDQLVGGGGSDLLLGGAGDDGLEGLWGDDTLDGGEGNDVLSGGWGSDVYVFGLGCGHDRIDNWDDDAAGTQPDKVVMGEGIAPEGVSVVRDGDDLVLIVPTTDDQLTLSGYFYAGDDAAIPVETIEFADGTVWDAGMFLLSGGSEVELIGTLPAGFAATGFVL